MSVGSEKSQSPAVYFDGACIVCDQEIKIYKKLDKKGNINFIDISLPLFDASAHKLDPDNIQKVFHVRDRHGQIVTGVAAFIEIWKEIDSLNILARLARFSPFRFILELGYKAFVVIRPYLPRKKCENNHCQL